MLSLSLPLTRYPMLISIYLVWWAPGSAGQWIYQVMDHFFRVTPRKRQKNLDHLPRDRGQLLHWPCLVYYFTHPHWWYDCAPRCIDGKELFEEENALENKPEKSWNSKESKSFFASFFISFPFSQKLFENLLVIAVCYKRQEFRSQALNKLSKLYTYVWANFISNRKNSGDSLWRKGY